MSDCPENAKIEGLAGSSQGEKENPLERRDSKEVDALWVSKVIPVRNG